MLSKNNLSGKFTSVDRQVSRLANLTRELLDVSRITGGSLKLEPEELDLVPLVNEVADRCSEDLARSGSTLSLELPEHLRGTWDSLRVDQVFQNLLSNAIKYGEGKPIAISLEAYEGTVQFQIRDQGIGISAEDQERIFDRFERVANARYYGGFGLGLWIVRQVLVAMGGSISVESELGLGATFTVTLPRSPPESHSSVTPAAPV